MASNVHYSALEHGGLELADRDEEGPEVVEHTQPGSDAPETLQNPRSSLDKPEVLHPGQYDVEHDAKMVAPYGPEESDGGVKPERNDNTAMAGALAEEDGGVPTAVGERKYLGMKRRTFIIVVVVAAFVIIAAIIGGAVGGVLGARKRRENAQQTEADPPINAGAGTGLAAAIYPDGTQMNMVMYYQQSDTYMYENVFEGYNGWYTNDTDGDIASSSNAATPLAATVYSSYGTIRRSIFWLDVNGNVYTANTSLEYPNSYYGNWSSVYGGSQISAANHAASPSDIGLAACASNDTAGLNGIRLYYGRVDGGVQELAYNFAETQNGWTETQYFTAADAASGIACTTYEGAQGPTLNLYFRNMNSSQVDRRIINFSASKPVWVIGPSTSTAIKAGSDVAACNDGTENEYVFYQTADGTITRALTVPFGGASNNGYSGYSSQAMGMNGTKLAAAYLEMGATVLFQNSTNTSEVWAIDNSRNGSPVFASLVY